MTDPSRDVDHTAEDRDFDLSAASIRAAGADLQTFVDVLGDKLDRALPGRVRVERRATRFLSKQKRVTAIEVDVGATRYLLAAKERVVEARVAAVVRGIVLRSETVSLEAWIDALLGELANEAETSEQSRLALQQLL